MRSARLAHMPQRPDLQSRPHLPATRYQDPQVYADPTTFLAGTGAKVRIRTRIFPHPGLDPASVRVFRVDDDLRPVGDALCQPKDNGDRANGDDLFGDSVYSCFITFLESTPSTIRLVAQVWEAGQTILSAPIALYVVQPLTHGEIHRE